MCMRISVYGVLELDQNMQNFGFVTEPFASKIDLSNIRK